MNLSTESLNNLEIRQRLQMRQRTFARVTAFIFRWNKPNFPADDALHGGLWRKKRAARTLMVRAADNQETLQQNRIA